MLDISNNLLSAKNINKSFGAVIAANDVNIDIQKGEKVSLIGSNGAGKTTFMNMVTGYLKPDTGNIYFKGEEIINDGNATCQTRRVKSIIEEFSMISDLSRAGVASGIHPSIVS